VAGRRHQGEGGSRKRPEEEIEEDRRAAMQNTQRI